MVSGGTFCLDKQPENLCRTYAVSMSLQSTSPAGVLVEKPAMSNYKKLATPGASGQLSKQLQLGSSCG